MFKISKISWFVFIGYLALAIGTYFLIAYVSAARDLFTSTEFLLQFNLVWFGLLIVLYGLYALYQNYKRINRLGLDESLDTQFLIVLTFIFMTIYATMDFYAFIYQDSLSQTMQFAIESTAKVIFYGAFVAGILSILLPKLLRWIRKDSGV